MNSIFQMLIGMLATIPVAGPEHVNTMKNVFDVLNSLQEKMNEPEENEHGG